MQKVFIPYLISCLDESMSVRMNKFTLPGFLFCPRKPHPKVKEYHTICSGENGIIYGREIFKERNTIISMRRPEFDTSPSMKTVRLMILPTRMLCITGKLVILDIGFYVLKGLL